MPDPKFGTIWRRYNGIVVMSLGRNSRPNDIITDEYNVAPGEVVCLVLADPKNATTAGYYPVLGTAWFDMGTNDDQWEKIG